jgi:hypothetical protein
VSARPSRAQTIQAMRSHLQNRTQRAPRSPAP